MLASLKRHLKNLTRIKEQNCFNVMLLSAKQVALSKWCNRIPIYSLSETGMKMTWLFAGQNNNWMNINVNINFNCGCSSIVDEVGEAVEASLDLETSDLSDKFVIVDADDACLGAASETCDSLGDRPDVSTLIDESTLSTSSVLRQWSSHSSGSPQSIDKWVPLFIVSCNLCFLRSPFF